MVAPGVAVLRIMGLALGILVALVKGLVAVAASWSRTCVTGSRSPSWSRSRGRHTRRIS
jgi:hypothetical protein